MNDIVKVADPVERQKLISTLQNSLYVGAKADSVEMVISYCEAAGLDPMQKPVHIVPMSVKDPVSGEYAYRDVIMMGVGAYRIQADRSQTMAGISAPVFGADITFDFVTKGGNKVSATFPEWCEVTAKKIVGSHIVEFTAREYWLENYATDSGKSTAPNKMWMKRPKGQLAKCAEAQVLRKAWPEIGQAPTAEEMDGKIIDMGDANVTADKADAEPESIVLPAYSDEDFEENKPKWKALILSGKSNPEHTINMLESRFTLTGKQKKEIEGLTNADS